MILELENILSRNFREPLWNGRRNLKKEIPQVGTPRRLISIIYVYTYEFQLALCIWFEIDYTYRIKNIISNHI